MKKRMILTNSLIVFCSLLLFLILCITSITLYNERLSAKHARNYLNLVCSLYHGDNEAETIALLKATDSDLRVTFITLEGSVIADSDLDGISESHQDRAEIINLGKIYKRYSNTLHCDMLYLAAEDNGVYVRIAIPVNSIQGIISSFLWGGILSLCVIFFVSIFLISYFCKKSLKPVNETVNALAGLTDSGEDFTAISIDDLPSILDLLKDSLDDKIQQISARKQQTYDVLNYINSGLLVIDNTNQIKLINDRALEIFCMQYSAIKNKSYLYLIRDVSLQDYISDSLIRKADNTYTLEMADTVYSVHIKYIAPSWMPEGLVLTLQDITQRVALEKMKREFFANASHELKSPLTCIIGYQQMITEGIETDFNTVLEYSKLTLKEANRMNGIVTDMLNLSKLERKEGLKPERVNLEELIADILESLRTRAEERGITIMKQTEPVEIWAERTQMDQLFRNLMDNAIKYNNLNGKIFIELNEQHFVIADTGIGISSEDQKRVFERFYRVDKAKSKVLGGTGLGLAIVKHICELYKFRILLFSELSKGTRIEIELK